MHKFAPPFYQVITNDICNDSCPQLNFFSINHKTVRNERLASSSSSTDHTINDGNIISKH